MAQAAFQATFQLSVSSAANQAVNWDTLPSSQLGTSLTSPMLSHDGEPAASRPPPSITSSAGNDSPSSARSLAALPDHNSWNYDAPVAGADRLKGSDAAAVARGKGIVSSLSFTESSGTKGAATASAPLPQLDAAAAPRAVHFSPQPLPTCQSFPGPGSDRSPPSSSSGSASSTAKSPASGSARPLPLPNSPASAPASSLLHEVIRPLRPTTALSRSRSVLTPGSAAAAVSSSTSSVPSTPPLAQQQQQQQNGLSGSLRRRSSSPGGNSVRGALPAARATPASPPRGRSSQTGGATSPVRQARATSGNGTFLRRLSSNGFSAGLPPSGASAASAKLPSPLPQQQHQQRHVPSLPLPPSPPPPQQQQLPSPMAAPGSSLMPSALSHLALGSTADLGLAAEASASSSAPTSVVGPIGLRLPKWLRAPPPQATDRVRSGRLQDLADALADCRAATSFDLGGLEFAGAFQMPASAVEGSTGARAARRRFSAAEADSAEQVLRVPAGLHVTLYNATLLLMAEQYILVGPGASLTLKGVEVVGCSREAGLASATSRRRLMPAASVTAGTAAAPAAGVPVPPAARPATASLTRTGSLSRQTSTLQPRRRTSSPGFEPQGAQAGGGGGGGFGVPLERVPEGSPERYARGLTPAGAGIGSSSMRRRSTSGGGAASAAAPSPPALHGLRASASGNGRGAGAAAAAAATQEGGEAAAACRALQRLASSTRTFPGVVDASEYVGDHALIEVQGGGVARISNCTIQPGRQQLALCVSDGGGCEVSYCTAGSCCAAGERAVLVALHSRLQGGSGCVSALQGAAVRVEGCEMQRSTQDGVEVRGAGTRALLVDTTIADCHLAGVAVNEGAQVELRDVRVQRCRGQGLAAAGRGTVVTATGSKFEDCTRSGAAVSGGAHISLSGCVMAGTSSGSGLQVEAGPPTPAWALVHDAAEDAGSPHAGGRQQRLPRKDAPAAILARCTLAANAGHGASVEGGCRAELDTCELYNNLYCGLMVEGAGSAAACTSCTFIKNEMKGVKVADGGRASLGRCTMSTNAKDGIAVEGPGSHVQLSRCECVDNRESGACVTGGATLDLLDNRLANNQHDGLAVGGIDSTCRALRSQFSGNMTKGVGVYMGGVIEMQECTAFNNVAKCMQVGDEGSRLALGRSCTFDKQPVVLNGGVFTRL